MKNKEQQAFYDGATHGRNQVLTNLLEQSDKLDVLMALFRKASNLAKAEKDPVKKSKLEAYSEGFRHSINVLNNLGDALEAYHNVVNADITVPLTPDDVKMLS